MDWIRERSRRRVGADLKSFERIYREIYSSGEEREEEVPESDLPDKTPKSRLSESIPFSLQYVRVDQYHRKEKGKWKKS